MSPSDPAFRHVPGGLTMTPRAVELIENLAEDLDRGRALLATLGSMTEPGAIRRTALEIIAISPTLSTLAHRMLSGRAALPDAVADLLEAFLARPTSLRLCYQLARTLHDEGLFAPALAFLLRFEQLAEVFGMENAQRARLDHDIGYCLSALGRHEEALHRFLGAADEQGDFAGFSCIGHTLLELGRMAEARDAFSTAMAHAAHPVEVQQMAPFVGGSERLLEFEGQRGGLDARDLHYVQTGGLVLELAGEESDGVVRGSGYHGGLTLRDPLEVARLLAKLRRVIDTFAGRRPTCVVPLHNTATPLSLAVARLLDLPHLSHLRAVSWDRPLVVATRLRAEDAVDWERFMDRLPATRITFALSADWTAESLPAVDIVGLLASSCRLFWEMPERLDDDPASAHAIARRLMTAVNAGAGRRGPLESYYRIHPRHRLAVHRTPTGERVQ